MPSNPARYQHLPLPRVIDARPVRRFPDKPERERGNLENRASHSAYLTRAGTKLVASAKSWADHREDGELHPLPPGIPFVLQTEEDIDLDFLRSAFDFEVIAEDENGYVLVASEAVDLAAFLDKARALADANKRAGAAAKVYAVVEDNEGRADRLSRILSPDLVTRWSALADDTDLVVDLGIACGGKQSVPRRRSRRPNETDEQFDAWNAHYVEGTRRWWQAFDTLMAQRECDIEALVASYSGEVLDRSSDPTCPDSFTMRVLVSSKGLRDIVYNYPYLFEVAEPDEAAIPDQVRERRDLIGLPQPQAPDENAPTVVIADSGLQERHVLIAPAVRSSMSVSLVSDELPSSVADLVVPNGHGTRVAGALLYPDGHPSGSYKLPCWLANIRILDRSGALSASRLPAGYIGAIIAHIADSDRNVRIVNHSVTASIGFRRKYMSSWAAAIDNASYENDVLFIQAAGNLPSNSITWPHRAVNFHLSKGRRYPEYLLLDECRIANPAQSFQALTVGSVAACSWTGARRRSQAQTREPSAFTSTGLGIWGCIKPDVVEVGGDLSIDSSGPPRAAPHPECSLELVRANVEPGPPIERSAFGTSFAAPRVAHLACLLQVLLPREPTLLYRALIVNSATWPEWAAEDRDPFDVLRLIGYGLPDAERAIESSDHRVTLVTSGAIEIGANTAHVYRIPIPERLRAPGLDARIRIDVTLSYVARPRRTRRNRRGYLSTWLDWSSSRLGETYSSFSGRVIEELSGLEKPEKGRPIQWVIRENADWGVIHGASRTSGTLQKDWVVIPAHDLPEDFCVAVVGHKGWDKTLDAKARYAVAVTFEAVDKDIELYVPIEAEVRALSVGVASPSIQVSADA